MKLSGSSPFADYGEWGSLSSDVRGAFFLVPSIPIATVSPMCFLKVSDVTEQAFIEVASKSLTARVHCVLLGRQS